MYYPVTIPWWVKKWIYPGFVWEIPGNDNQIYLSFDDGPHPVITPFVLDELKKHEAKASFFCIGSNVKKYPDVYKRILEEGHTIGNHTQDHMNGWKTPDAVYFQNVAEAAQLIDSRLFRPPYGRITRFQAKQLRERWGYQIIMWSALSGDFDSSISWEKCLKNSLKDVRAGSIIVLHDSEKAYNHLRLLLPRLLDELQKKGYAFGRIIA